MIILSAMQDAFSYIQLFFQNEKTRTKFKFSLLGTMVFYLVAHGFVCLNFSPVHDGLNYMTHLASSWEVFAQIANQ